ncbi:tRNA (adenosine(37)-N6)-dimethylallyltransferase MiaA [Candidatus Avelusimicrobium facis]|uniref:tRNA (adenosine(37)-N6)-dimethylallyltransferase MiaA n=1 Tax=Candidatus Avelusimicrobium facis TaxID=3416203 RepID=UPI003D0AC589
MKHLVLAGPTASGKTELALSLAKRLKTQIISADSRQIYRNLTVGTAKPQGTWQDGVYRVDGVPYHLVDFAAPQQTFDAAAFCAHARALTDAQPEKSFIFAGGTGMYLHAFFVGMDPLPPSNAALRAELTAWAQTHGKEALHARLAEKDPVSAQQIPPGNIQRILRALEITLLAGQPASALKSGRFFGQFPAEQALFVYLHWDKELLRQRIAKRTRAMLDPMAAETRTLLDAGAAPDCPALKSLGYFQILQWLRGEKTREETFEKICTLTCQYAKRQRTWFNRYKNALRLDFNQPQDFDVEKVTGQITSLLG